MKEIANTSRYSLYFLPEKNRFYLTILGHWKTPDEVPRYLGDWQRALTLCKPGFTILADIRKMYNHPPEVVQQVHLKAQKILIEAGLLRTVDVVPKNMLAEAQVDAIAKISKMPKDKFFTVEQAEIWLDKIADSSVKHL